MQATLQEKRRQEIPSLNTTSGLGAAAGFGAVNIAVNLALSQQSGGAVLTGSDAGHQAIAANYAGSILWLQSSFTRTDGTTGNTVNTTNGAVLLNPYTVLTVGHNVSTSSTLISSIDSVTVGQGNFQSAATNIRTVPFSNVIIFPGYNPANSANTIDLAIIHLDQPILSAPNLTLGTAAPGETVYSVGYGQWGWSASSLNPRDGNARGWEARVQGMTLTNPDEFYNHTAFGYDNAGLSYNGRLANGDSGGPVFNQYGHLVGINKAFASSSSIYTDTNQPDINSWIVANTIPEPGAFMLFGVAVAAFSSIRKRFQTKKAA